MKTKNLSIKKGQAGFTLVELLVVVMIIGILAAIGIPQYFKTVERSRIAEVQDNYGTIASAEERYFAKTGGYNTTDLGLFDVNMPSATAVNGSSFMSGTSGYTQDFKVELGGSAGVYSLVYSRTGSAPARYGTNYTITYLGCGGGNVCNASSANANVMTDLLQ